MTKRVLRFIICTLVCYLGCLTSVWAESGGSEFSKFNVDCESCDGQVEDLNTGATSQPPEQEVVHQEGFGQFWDDPDAIEPNADTDADADAAVVKHDLSVAKDWQKGFDFRFHIGPGLLMVDKSSYALVTVYDLGRPFSMGSAMGIASLNISIDLGYRWLYGGIYLHAGFMGYISPGLKIGLATSIYGKFYIPLTEKLEVVLNAGVGMETNYIVFPLGVGLNWHRDHTVIGVELLYVPGTLIPASSGSDVHELRPTFTVGYTF